VTQRANYRINWSLGNEILTCQVEAPDLKLAKPWYKTPTYGAVVWVEDDGVAAMVLGHWLHLGRVIVVDEGVVLRRGFSCR
jgi:hypothetical protein